MEPLYSILLCNQSISIYNNRIREWLQRGIKVIWFSTNPDEVYELKSKHKNFTKAFLLQAYTVAIKEKICIVDGMDPSNFVRQILKFRCQQFNTEQYLVEHCKADEHIEVQASAGTGKTTVMIDRILFLLHTVPDLHLPEIYMVTFTNDATDQMNRKLQTTLMTRYDLTRDKKYLRWLEEQSQMNISTIHSFAYRMLREYGISQSFTKNLSIRSYTYEKKELIKDAVDAIIDENKPVRDQLGINFYPASNLTKQFWEKFQQIGISYADMHDMDWGAPKDNKSQMLHKLLMETIPELDDLYFDIKRKNNGVGVEDIMRDLQEVILSDYCPKPDISMKYLFIDEFQDSDLSQIMVACLLTKLLNSVLFVVGDIKQCIYRFRGSNDQSFDILHEYMREMNIKRPVAFELVKNYRTSASVLNKMNRYFTVWGKHNYLQYRQSVIPLNRNDGMCKMLFVENIQEVIDKMVAQIANDQLDDLLQRIKTGKLIPSEKTRVVLLARTHGQVKNCSEILRKNKIPSSVNEEGSFYASEAIRDFYLLVSSFMFPDEPKYIFDYLLTPYAGEIDPLNINDMEMLHADYDNLIDYLDHFLDQTNWKKYHKEMRLKPLLSVFKEIMDEISVVDNYITNRKKVLQEHGWEEDRCNAQTFTDARQYQANLEKLMGILQRNFGRDKVSIYDIYNFLKLNVATNRNENEARVQTEDDYRSILCMTVHKAKGLEYDTVIIPFTDHGFITFDITEILIDPIEKRVAWNYLPEGGKKNSNFAEPRMQSSYYEEMKKKDKFAAIQEETRILYVAMTRAINNFICLVPPVKNKNTWAAMFNEVGVDYE